MDCRCSTTKIIMCIQLQYRDYWFCIFERFACTLTILSCSLPVWLFVVVYASVLASSSLLISRRAACGWSPCRLCCNPCCFGWTIGKVLRSPIFTMHRTGMFCWQQAHVGAVTSMASSLCQFDYESVVQGALQAWMGACVAVC